MVHPGSATMTERLQTNLRRLLAPRTIAVVGASESRPMSNNVVRPLLRAGHKPFLVTPRHPTLYGCPTVASLAAIGEPIDAIVAIVNAEQTVDIARQAGELKCGGIVAVAGGFGEGAGEGGEFRDRLLQIARAADIAVIGPNCTGFVNVPQRISLFTGGELELREGGLSIISQSGFLTRAALAAARRRQLGVALGISSGNEIVCDLTDYLDYLIADQQTQVICLVLETLRDPNRFFGSVARARLANKPVIALKLGRTDRARGIMRSHTGAIADESWIYEIGFRQAGVLVARDVDDLIDQAALFVQLPPTKWKPISNVSILTTSGGAAALAADICEEQDVGLPEMSDVTPWLAEHIPGMGSANPLDMTGFIMTNPATVEEMFSRCMGADEIDATVLCWWCAPGDEAWASMMTAPFGKVAQENNKPALLTTIEDTEVGEWTTGLRRHGVASFGGLRSLTRSAKAMTAYLRSSPGTRGRIEDAAKLARPDAPAIATAAGPMLSFGATMELLRRFGVPHAPFALVRSAADIENAKQLGNTLVVKLANIPHRTEFNAVRVNVEAKDLVDVVADLQRLAAREKFDSEVVVQAMVRGQGEAFAGLKTSTSLGPLIIFGLGGVFVELTQQHAGRLLPISAEDVNSLLDEVGGETVFAGLRNQASWNKATLAAVLTGLSKLAIAGRDWIDTLELNPIICDSKGAVAVDAVCLLQSPDPQR